MKIYSRTNAEEDDTTTKRLQGTEPRFGTEPDEIYLELRMGSPAYVHLEKGDYLREGDAFHRDRLRPSSPTLATWEVVDITPEIADAVAYLLSSASSYVTGQNIRVHGGLTASV